MKSFDGGIRRNSFLFFVIAWIGFWILPWTEWLASLPWIRVALSIILFATPGMTISIFLISKRLTLLGHFTAGISISVLLVGSLGIYGRVFHTSFEFIKIAFALMGLVGLFALRRSLRSEDSLFKPLKLSPVTATLLLGMIVFGITVTFQNRFAGDDLSYLAYLTNWQHAHHLNFSGVIFGSANLDRIRFWLAMLPMSWALLAEISKLHGLLLLGYYLEPYLLPIAILSAYNFYEDLLQSKYRAIAALLLQFIFLFLLQDSYQAGRIFFFRLSEDKAFAAFILAPVFFLAIHLFFGIIYHTHWYGGSLKRIKPDLDPSDYFGL